MLYLTNCYTILDVQSLKNTIVSSYLIVAHLKFPFSTTKLTVILIVFKNIMIIFNSIVSNLAQLDNNCNSYLWPLLTINFL